MSLPRKGDYLGHTRNGYLLDIRTGYRAKKLAARGIELVGEATTFAVEIVLAKLEPKAVLLNVGYPTSCYVHCCHRLPVLFTITVPPGRRKEERVVSAVHSLGSFPQSANFACCSSVWFSYNAPNSPQRELGMSWARTGKTGRVLDSDNQRTRS